MRMCQYRSSWRSRAWAAASRRSTSQGAEAQAGQGAHKIQAQTAAIRKANTTPAEQASYWLWIAAWACVRLNGLNNLRDFTDDGFVSDIRCAKDLPEIGLEL